MQRAEEGQGLVEYALILLFIAIAIAATASLLGSSVMDSFQAAVDSFP